MMSKFNISRETVLKAAKAMSQGQTNGRSEPRPGKHIDVGVGAVLTSSGRIFRIKKTSEELRDIFAAAVKEYDAAK